MAPAMMRRAIRTALFGLALGAVGLLVALVLLEAGFRAYYFAYPSMAKGFFWVPSVEYGWGLDAGHSAFFFDDHGEFHTFVRINSKGLRDVEHEYEKPPGTFRVLILGDSYMEALQVDLEQTFARLLEQRLKVSAARRVEVINTGVAAYGTDNEFLFLRHEGYKYQPDLVLLMFTSANDVRESYRPFNQLAVGAQLTKPHFRLNGDGNLVQLEGDPPSPPVPWWRKRLRVGEYLYRRLGGEILPPSRRDVGIPPPKDPKVPYVPAGMFVYSPEYHPAVEQAWRVTKALIREIRREAGKHGAQLAVVVHNGPWVHHDEHWNRMFFRHPMGRNVWDRRKPDRIASEFLAAEGIPFVNLFDAFEAAKQPGPLFFDVDPHWRPAGHRVAAGAVAQFLLSDGLVPSLPGRR
jgi:hypothetical protein